MFPTLMPFVVYRLCPEYFVFASTPQSVKAFVLAFPSVWDYWIEITNAADSSKVDFSDGIMIGSSPLQGSNLGPASVGWIVLEHLQTSKISHHQFFTQHLISVVILIVSTGDNHLLVQVSSSGSM